MSLQAVKTLVLSNGISLEVVSGHIAAGNQTEEIDTTTLTDATYMTNVPRYQTEDTDLTFMCAFAGVLATIGAATLVITALDTADGTDVCTVPVLVRSAIPQEVAIDGERRMLQQVICTPTGAAITYA